MNAAQAGGAGRWDVRRGLICVFLAAATLAAFSPALRNGFVNYDDDVYVYQNPQVRPGLTGHGVRWAFTRSHGGNWHPLTWISHMADCSVYRLDPWGHHFTSIALHAVSAILLFLVLEGVSGALFRSAFAAALFAVHPLRVESVAWVAERKDVLSGVFFLLTLAVYVRAVSGPEKGLARQIPVWLFFALGLLSKPTLVTTPFVLLLLDAWPLRRFGRVSASRLVAEKIPLFALSAAACVITALAQRGSIQPMERVPAFLRLGNAAVSYVVYLRQMAWPARLAVLYPFQPEGPPAWKILVALLLLAACSAAFFLVRRRRPYLLVGWLWYLGMLVPVIGLIQVGAQSHADRYTYLPQIGIYVALAWLAGDIAASSRLGQAGRCAAAAVLIAALVLRTRDQATYWRDGESLWTHPIACTSRNGVAENDLGNIFIQEGRLDDAIGSFQKAVEFQPRFAFAWSNLGNAFAAKRHLEDAAVSYRKAIEVDPAYAEAHFNYGNALFQGGRLEAAMAQYRAAIVIRAEYGEAHANLGSALFRAGRTDAAILEYQRALASRPGDEGIRKNLDMALAEKAHSTIKSQP